MAVPNQSLNGKLADSQPAECPPLSAIGRANLHPACTSSPERHAPVWSSLPKSGAPVRPSRHPPLANSVSPSKSRHPSLATRHPSSYARLREPLPQGFDERLTPRRRKISRKGAKPQRKRMVLRPRAPRPCVRPLVLFMAHPRHPWFGLDPATALLGQPSPRFLPRSTTPPALPSRPRLPHLPPFPTRPSPPFRGSPRRVSPQSSGARRREGM